MAKSLAQITREILAGKPYYKYVLEQNIANHSALAGKIKANVESALGRKVSLDAIAVAIRRYSETLTRTAAEHEKALLKLLAKSKINLKNDVADVTFKKDYELKSAKPLHIIRGINATEVILEQDDLEKINLKDAVKVRENLVELTIVTPPEVESIPGWVHYITGLLAENNINIVEVVSCYTDTILVLEEKDALKAYEILRAKMK